jgi:hemin uptake protein HemP
MNSTDTMARPPQAAQDQQGMEIIPADRLLGAARAVVIEHRGERYELRLTRNGKLILTK